jgi:hypothetical protein
MIATNGKLCNFCIEENNEEFDKCRENPYYFMTKYMTVNGEPFATPMSEKSFNEIFKKLSPKS